MFDNLYIQIHWLSIIAKSTEWIRNFIYPFINNTENGKIKTSVFEWQNVLLFILPWSIFLL